MFALVDCNNFFVSCERVFRPDLQNKPVCILSNNDGCIISRSDEVKQIGIPMGAPYFKYKDVIKKHNVEVFSSNYHLYGDLSNRVMSSLSLLVKKMEVYSIDEAFLDFSDYDFLYAKYIKSSIEQWTGISVSVGVAKTKTLAKLANYYAKKRNGVFYLDENDKKLLSEIEIDKVWGVSYRSKKKLNDLGIYNVCDLQKYSPDIIREKFTIIGQRMQAELNGDSVYQLSKKKDKKNIAATRSFGKKISNINDVKESVANHVVRAADKLRKQNSKLNTLFVMLKAKNSGKFIRFSAQCSFQEATDNVMVIMKAANNIVEQIFKPGSLYIKSGVLFADLVDKRHIQKSFFVSYDDDKYSKVIEDINNKYGQNSIYYLSQGINRHWQMKSDLKSKKFTTSWDELLVVN